MLLSELEKFVAHCGIFGCPLEKIPTNLLNELENSEILEIVQHSQNIEFPSNLLVKSSADVVKLKDIDEFSKFDLKLNLEAWRRLVYKGKRSFSVNVSKFINILIKNPQGLTQKQLNKEGKDIVDLRVKQWTQDLQKHNILKVEDDLIKYNFDWIDGEVEMPRDLFTSVEYCVNAKHATNLNYKGIYRQKQLLSPSQITTKEQMDEKMEIAKMEIKKNKNGIELRRLKNRMHIENKSFDRLVTRLSESGFSVLKDGAHPRIKFEGKLENSYYEPEMISYLVDMCTSARMFILNDLPAEIEKMKITMELDDEQFLKILEDHQFSIIECKSKYAKSKFVVFSSSVNEEDSELIEIFDKTKENVQENFKLKIRETFLSNVYLNSFDNNYSPFLNERIHIFYNFLLTILNKNDNYFCLNRNSLMQMNFASFVKCVPLREEQQFLKITIQASKKFKVFEEALKNTENFTIKNNLLMEAAEKVTVGDVLRSFKSGSPDFKKLSDRIAIFEFSRIIDGLVKFNIFEGFSSDKFLYFEKIEGISSYIERLLSNLTSDGETVVSYENRLRFYESVCDLNENEFSEKAKKIAKVEFSGADREFFLRKLENF